MQNIPGFEEHQKQQKAPIKPAQEQTVVQKPIVTKDNLLKDEIKALTLWPRLKNSSGFWYLLGIFTFATAGAMDIKVAKTLQHDFDSPFFDYNIAIQGSILGLGALVLLVTFFKGTELCRNISPDKIFRNLIQLRDNPYFASSDAASLREMDKLGLNILKNCSGIDPLFIENLKNGKYDHTIDYSQAIAIIEGYLATHKKEQEEVLKAFNKIQLPQSMLDILQAAELRDEVRKTNPAIAIQQTKGM